MENRKTIDLVVLDLDGTLLNSQHSISALAKQTLQRLSEKGIVISVATGRGKIDVIKYVQLLELPQKSVPCIAYNGAFGMLLETVRYGVDNAPAAKPTTIFQHPLSAAETRRLLQFAADNGLVTQYYCSETGDVYAAPKNELQLKLVEKDGNLVGKPHNIVPNYEVVIEQMGPASKLQIMTEDPDALVVHAHRECLEKDFHIIKGSPDPFFVEFLPTNVNKGTALKQLLKTPSLIANCCTTAMEKKNIAKFTSDSKVTVVAFGDGDNDVEMLQCADLGIAMGNASPALKSIADRVSAFTNNEDAVVREIEYV